MKKIFFTLTCSILFAMASCSGGAKKAGAGAEATTFGKGIEKAEKSGWHLAIQSYSFNRFTLIEALDKTHELGLKFIEVYPGHKLGAQWGDKRFGFDMTPEERTEIKKHATSKGVKIIATGVYTTDDATTWEKMFLFAKDMGIEIITCEPAVKDWDLVEKLSKEHNIKVSVHNHPQPSEYWTPDNLLAQISTRSKSIGSGADVGHWRREGLSELECIKKLEGRVISLHFKDIAEKKEGEAEQHDVIWGTGILDINGMLKELKRQNFKGVFAIEYEYNWDNSVPDIKKCIEYYDKVTNEIF